MGAWIETYNSYIVFFSTTVAPHMGAWIETYSAAALNSAQTSHPIWVRGLKPERET